MPDKKTFTEVLMAKGENYEALREEIKTLISLLLPFLEDIHTTLVSPFLCSLLFYLSTSEMV